MVIKGATPHFDYVCGVAAHGHLAASPSTPACRSTFGVITALTEEQAWERAGGAVGNRGEEAALAALEMAGWLRRAPARGPAARSADGQAPQGAASWRSSSSTSWTCRARRSAEPHFDEFWTRHPVDAEVREFAEALVRGTKLHQEKIDELIDQYAEHWELERMAVVDRNILREGIFELLWAADVPPKVAINEALEVAKKFSTHESSRFINGILDRIHKELRAPS